jgi:eukaryotic-like serine/threonine-protein kinase
MTGTTELNRKEYSRLQKIFRECLDAPEEERQSILERLGGESPRLREEVEALLKHAPATLGVPIDVSPLIPGKDPDDFDKDALIGTTIRSYRIIRHIDSGGMGSVYEAEQEHPKRLVALKVLRRDLFSESVQRRFELECQILAKLSHRGIAHVIESGTFKKDDREYPFYTMELVPDAATLLEYAEAQKLDTADRLRLMIEVCEAVHHGHLNGIMHRDLKPANILVDPAGQPKIIDFGVARVTNSDIATATTVTTHGQIIGTLSYMSPEQCSGDPDAVDARADVYSLGVVLYQLLSGRIPFELEKKLLHEAVRIIREEEPTKLGTHLAETRGDVETIVGKALEKEKERRYQSVPDFSGDIRRYLLNEPVVARPPSTWYQLSKFARRNRTLVGGVIAVVLVAVIGAGVSFRFAILERDQRRLSEKRAEELKTVTEFQQSMLGDIDAWLMGSGMVNDQREQIRTTMEGKSRSGEEIKEALASFGELVKKTNATDIALNVVDEQILQRAARTIEDKFFDQPLIRAALQQAIASTYKEIGRYEKARPLAEAALRIRQEELGDDHPDTLTAINNMGILLHSMGKFEEARPFYRRALDGGRRVHGDDHPDTLTTIGNTGNLLVSMSKFEEALPFCREALAGRIRVLGNDHPDTLISINNMGFLLESMGRFEEAEPFYREAVAGSRRVQGNDHSGTLTTIANMGVLLESMGRFEEAESFYREALEGSRRVLGNDHPDTLGSINNMGFLLDSMGRFEEAGSFYREALDGFRRVFGDDHAGTLTSLANMAGLLSSMGKYEEAEPFCREALDGRRRVLGDDHPDTLISIGDLGFLLFSTGRSKEAEPLYREALEGFRLVLGKDHPWVLGAINNLGHLLETMGRLKEAEPLLRKGMDGRRRLLGDDHPDTLNSINNLACLLSMTGRIEEAESLYREALAGKRLALGDDHPNTLIAIGNLGFLLSSTGRFKESDLLYREALEGFRRVLGDDHPNTVTTIDNMGEVQRSMGNFEEAERLCLECYERRLDRFGLAAAKTTAAIERLVVLYASWNKAEPGKGYNAKAVEWRKKMPGRKKRQQGKNK